MINIISINLRVPISYNIITKLLKYQIMEL